MFLLTYPEKDAEGRGSFYSLFDFIRRTKSKKQELEFNNSDFYNIVCCVFIYVPCFQSPTLTSA